MDINKIILQLSNKVELIKARQQTMKSSLQRFSLICNELSGDCLPQLKKCILSSFQNYHDYNKKNLVQICSNYQHQIQQQKGYYQYEIEQLKSQIHRQYKVIGLMKQQVQDLMILLNQQHNNRIIQEEQRQNQSNNKQQTKLKYLGNHNSCDQNQQDKNYQVQKNNKLDLRGNMMGQLQTIYQEETQRTFISNCELNELNNQQFIQYNQHMQELKAFQTEEQKLKLISYSQSKKYPNFIRIDQQKSVNQLQHSSFQQQSKVQMKDYSENDKKQCKSEKNFLEKLQNIKNNEHLNIQNNFSRYLSERNGTQKWYESNKKQQLLIQQNQNNEIDSQSSNSAFISIKNQNLRDKFIQQNENEEWSKKGVFEYLDYKQGNQASLQDSSRNLRMQQPLQIDYSDRYNKVQSLIGLEYLSKNSQNFTQNSQIKQMKALQYLQVMLNNDQKSKKSSRVTFNSNNHSERQLKNIDCNSFNNIHQNNKKTVNNPKLQYLVHENDQMNSNSHKKPVRKSSSHKGKQNNIQIYKKQVSHKSKKEVQKQITKVHTGKQNQNKTKQFLQQFRKTFNKCLSDIQVTKKYSTKLIKDKSASNIQNHFQFDFFPSPAYTEQQFLHSQETHNNEDQKSISPQSNCSPKKTRSLQATFGKNKKSIQKQRKSFQNKKSFLKKGKTKNIINESYPQSLSDSKQHSSENVNIMMKELQNHNKFLVGSKQLELKYDGQKKQGLRNGNGILHYSNGLWYEGQFKNNMRNGYGILRFNHIQLYNGEWKDDQLHGQGKIRNCAIINKKKTSQNTLSSTINSQLNKWISYCGYFKNNRFEGEGTLYLQGGQKFMGSFIGGNANGEGTLYRKTGQVQMGVWKHNIFMQIF